MIIFLELAAWAWLIALCIAVYKFVESINDLRVYRATKATLRAERSRRVRFQRPHLHLHRPRGARA